MFTKNLRACVALSVLGLVGCSDMGQVEPVGEKRQESTAIPEAGFVPYPILVNPANQQPILGNSGQYQGAWDGSVADLIAADAYAMCALQSSFAGIYQGQSRAGQDEYLKYLLSKMGEVDCEPVSNAFIENIWLTNRTSRDCNIDSRTGTLSRIDTIQRESTGFASFYSFDNWDLSGDDGVIEAARRRAAVEIEYSDLNLCMAQYMRGQLNSGQSLFTSSADLTEILGVIRERAQLASIYYGLLSKVISWEGGSEPNELTSAENDWLVLVRRWAHDIATPGELARIGEDFATSVRLLIQSTHNLATTFQRSAGQRPVGDSGFDRAERDWGHGQPRIRLMNLLYGGDPIGQPHARVRGRGIGGNSTNSMFFESEEVPAFVSVDMRDPRVGTLLGLARAADALSVKLALDDLDVPNGFDVEASAERLYQSVETEIKFQQCERQTPGSCDAEAIRAALPPIEEFLQYDLWQTHRVEPRSAEVIAQALAEAFGELVKPTLSYLEYRKYDGSMHLAGQHALEVIDGSDWIHIDKDFRTASFAGHELAADYVQRYYLPERLVLDADPYDQGFAVEDQVSTKWQDLRELGAVSALAFVREALVDGSLVGGSRQAFFDAAGVVLPDLNREIGERSVIVRPELEKVPITCTSGTFQSGAQCEQMFAAFTGNAFDYRVNSVTKAADPMDELTLAPSSPQLHTVAADPDTVGFDGLDRATLDAYPTVAAATTPYVGFADGYEKRSFPYSLEDFPLHDLLLSGPPVGGSGERVYMSLISHLFFQDGAFYISAGGELHKLAEQTMKTLGSDWSRPAYDAFGFPADWVPPADASLVGGVPGEQSYTYYLGVAKRAAEEATAAVQVAIDNLITETEQEVELEVAEQRAEAIADIETTAICGQGALNCSNLPMRSWNRNSPAPDCTKDDRGTTLSATAQVTCTNAVALRTALLPQFHTTEAAFSATTPTFAEFQGGELQGVLVRQWNAIKTLRLVDNAIISDARAIATEIEASEAGVNAAAQERNAATTAIDAELAQINASNAEIEAMFAELNAAVAQYNSEWLLLKTNMERECSEDAIHDANMAGTSWSDVDYRFVNEDGWVTSVGYDGQKSWSAGPMFAQEALCDAETDRFYVFDTQTASKQAAIDARIQALLALGALAEPQRIALGNRRIAAVAAHNAAIKAANASRHVRWVEFNASLTGLQSAIAEVVSSQVAYGQLQTRLQAVSAEANLEKDLAQKQADARFGIQRKFRSYDMWRARALLESARRLAVAARRSIESHFVVDLSELQATQAFVESPALWADEVYGSDLDAPSVVGLSAAPQIDDAVFPNKLLDYVENLERFVQGYTISYPTALAEPDTEVVTLPGPDVRLVIDNGDESVETVAADSAGWTFFCDDAGSWSPNPGIGQSPLEDALEHLCDGLPPSRARYDFSLDPWGRLGGSIGVDPLDQRHNVRWKRLAVNLVGTGVRDCQAARDPLACYSEPFLRYDLKHVGPAWTTNHAQEWRAFDLPTALVEDAKALAAEEWLDPLTNSWNTALVSNAARGELFARSIGGSYRLELELGPDVRLDRIERVQLLVQTQYWVRQE